MSESLEGRSYLPPEEPLEKECLLASISLLMGCLSWIAFPFFGGIFAILLGHIARVQIARSEGRLTGDKLAVVGLWLGYLNIGLVSLAVVCVAGVFLLPAIGRLLSK